MYQSNPFDLIRPSWEGVKLNVLSYISLIAIFIGVSIAGVVGLIVVGFVAPALVFLLGAVLVLVFLYFAITRLSPAIYRLQLAMGRHQKMTLRQSLDVQAGVGWRMFWTGVLAGLAVLGGLLLLIIPGLIFMVWFSQCLYVVLEENLSGVAALRRSRELVRGRFVDVLGTISLTQIPGLAYVVPVIGNLVSIVAGFVILPAMAIRYDQLVALKKADGHADVPTSPANYAAIILAAISLVVTAGYSAKNMPDSYQSQYKQSIEQKYNIY